MSKETNTPPAMQAVGTAILFYHVSDLFRDRRAFVLERFQTQMTTSTPTEQELHEIRMQAWTYKVFVDFKDVWVGESESTPASVMELLGAREQLQFQACQRLIVVPFRYKDAKPAEFFTLGTVQVGALNRFKVCDPESTQEAYVNRPEDIMGVAFVERFASENRLVQGQFSLAWSRIDTNLCLCAHLISARDQSPYLVVVAVIHDVAIADAVRWAAVFPWLPGGERRDQSAV